MVDLKKNKNKQKNTSEWIGLKIQFTIKERSRSCVLNRMLQESAFVPMLFNTSINE